MIKTPQQELWLELDKMGIEVVGYGAIDQLLLQPILWDQIKETQRGHHSIEGIKNRLKEKEISCFSIDSEGILWYAFLQMRT